MKTFGLHAVLCMIFFVSILHAQKEITFDRLTATDGLSGNNVLSVCQDQYGFLWIATNDGLNRFDGYNFKVFKHEPGDTTSLPSNELNMVYVDREGILWVGSLAGLSRWDRDSGRFQNFEPIPSNTGVAQQSVLWISEDSQKRLWVGTRWNGLFLFDRQARTFEQMKVNINNSISTTANAITDVLESASGKIYIGTWHHGLLEYDEIEDIFKLTRLDPGLNRQFVQNLITAFHQDKEGIIWMGTLEKGLFRYDPETKNLDAIPLINQDKVKTLWIRDFYEDGEGFLWIATTNGLYRYHLRSKESIQYKYDPKNQLSIAENRIWSIFHDKYDMLWIGTQGGGLSKYNKEKIPFEHFSILKQTTGEAGTLAAQSLSIPANEKNKMWIGTNDGLVYFDRTKNDYDLIDNIPSLNMSLKDNQIDAMHMDESGRLWMGVNRNGLLMYNTITQKFYNYDPYRPEINSGAGKRIFHIEPDDYGKLWIGTRGGLYRFDPNTSTWSLIPAIENRIYDTQLINLLRSVSNQKSTICSIVEVGDNQDLTEEFSLDSPSDILIASVGEGTLTWDMVDYGWLENENGDTLFSASDINNSFYLNGDMKNRISVGILNLPAGKYKLRYFADDSHCYGNYNVEAPADSQWWGIQAAKISSQDARSFGAVLSKQNSKSYIYDSQVNVVEYGRNGLIWIGTTRGFSKYELQSKNVTNYRHDKDNPKTLSNDIVTDIHEDEDGFIWLTTESGLNRFDPIKESFTSYFEKDGLPSAQLMSIEEDQSGNLWIGSINGISKLEKRNDSDKFIFINYDTEDGLQGYIFNRHASFISHDGEMFFGGRNGLNAFFPGKINTNPADIVISEFFISNQEVNPVNSDSPLEKHILETDQIELSYDQNDLSFELATLHFARPERNSLAYKLEGLNDTWIENPHRFISFTNLNSGNYKLRVRGANSDGIGSSKERVLNITIFPPWWRTTWAYFLYAFLFAGLVFSIDRVQRYRLTQHERNRAQIREAELRAQTAEAQAKLIEAENKRKTLELEEARKIQLSMLPRHLPQLANLSIAVYMQTATEVGGDYYDFHVGLDGTLTVVIGDATGHGMKAGTMVTTAKSLFNSYAPNPDILFSFREITRCIKQMNLDKLSMCMSMLKIRENNLLMSSAGMPPILLFRREDRTVEEHLIQGMPLGAMEKFPYEIKETTLAPGDTIMLMSDGLAELQNEQKKMFGYQQVRNIFEEVADKNPEEIINHLKNEGTNWLGGNKPDDDITFVVIQVEK
jgi:ligand-binding sensor domain-containing protein/serine phosphatase RsbU (regulator of sigma subunit)